MDIKEEPVDVADHALSPSQCNSLTSTIGSKIMMDVKVEVEEFCDDRNDFTDSDQDMQMVIDEEANELSKLLEEADAADLNKDAYAMQDNSTKYDTYEELIENTLAAHKVLCSESSGELHKYACDVCKLSWEKLWLFTRHLNMNHRGVRLNIVTEKLNYGSDYLIVAQAKDVYKCSECDTTSDTHEEHEMHTLKECSSCRNTFQTCSDLQEHVRTCGKATTVHSELAYPKCKVCSKGFLTNQRLRSHLIDNHQVRSDEAIPVNLRLCVKCKESYVGLRALHNCSKRRNRYYCKFCQQGFQTIILLKVHRKAMTGTEKDCERCGKVFTWICQYTTHPCTFHVKQKEMSKEKPQPTMQCSICDEFFRTKADIFYHMTEIHNIFKVQQKEAMILNIEHTKTIPIILKRTQKKISSTKTGKLNVNSENGSHPWTDNDCINNTAQSATEKARNTLNVVLSKAVKCHTTKSQSVCIQNYNDSIDSINNDSNNQNIDRKIPRIDSVMSLLKTSNEVQNVITGETKIKQEVLDDDIVYDDMDELNEEIILADDTKFKIEHVEPETDMLTPDDIRKVFYPTTIFQTKVKQEPVDEDVKGTAKRKTKLTTIKTEDEKLEIEVVSEEMCDEEVYEDDIIVLNSREQQHIVTDNNIEEELKMIDKSSKRETRESIYCIKCKKYYRNFGLYISHFNHKELHPMQCPICWKMHSSTAQYGQHALVHMQHTYRKSSIHNHRYECKKCLQEVSSVQRRNHWLQHHSMINKATCVAAKAVTKPVKAKPDDIPVLSNLLSADQLKHTLVSMTEMGNKMRSKVCTLCSKSFSRISDYKRHLIMHCLEDAYIKKSYLGSLRCQHCEADLANADWYKQHMREHAGLTSYQCHLCCKCFSDSSNFSKHKKVHNIQVMFCDLCQRKFKSKKMLIRHLEEHSKTEPIVCNLCSKTFHFQSSYYKHHVNAHSSHLLQRYKCQECKCRFTCLKNKWDHMWERHGERSCRADCDLCGAGFRKFQDLRAHMAAVHHIKRPSYCDSSPSEVNKRIKKEFLDMPNVGIPQINHTRSELDGKKQKSLLKINTVTAGVPICRAVGLSDECKGKTGHIV